MAAEGYGIIERGRLRRFYNFHFYMSKIFSTYSYVLFNPSKLLHLRRSTGCVMFHIYLCIIGGFQDMMLFRKVAQEPAVSESSRESGSLSNNQEVANGYSTVYRLNSSNCGNVVSVK